MESQSPKHIDEPTLVKQLKRKDRQALVYLYDHYAAALYGVVIRTVKDEDVAEEVLQDTFIRIWDKIDTYDPEKGKLFTWMLNIARNLSIDKLRSREFSVKSKTDSLENDVSSVTDRASAEQKLPDPGLKNVLQSLHPDQQLVIRLIYFEGYTHQEVAEEFNIPLGTVKTRLRAAIIKLRKILQTL